MTPIEEIAAAIRADYPERSDAWIQNLATRVQKEVGYWADAEEGAPESSVLMCQLLAERTEEANG